MNTVVNLKHEPRLREEFEHTHVHDNTALIDRRTKWGNPFTIGRDGTREEVIARYRADLWRRIRAGEISLEDLAELDGMWLACWCHPLPCHGHVLARAAAWAAGQLRSRANDAQPILFWSRCPAWGWLSNFAAAGFTGPDAAHWPTVEHWYQAGKTGDPATAERIRTARVG